MTCLPSPAPNAAAKLVASLDVLEEILLLACLNNHSLGLPTALGPLSLACRYFHGLLSTRSSPSFFSRLFFSSFGIQCPARFMHDTGSHTKEVLQVFWEHLKKFRGVSQGHQICSSLNAADWNFVSSFLSLLESPECQAHRQLIIYAQIDKVAATHLIENVSGEGMNCQITWLAMDVWLAVDRSSCPLISYFSL